MVIDRYEVKYAHSATVQNEITPNKPTALIASFASEYSSYPSNLSTEQEAAEIYKLMGGNGYLNLKATKQDFLNHYASHEILHIASHTQTNINNPFKSGFIFEPVAQADSFNILTISDIYKERLDANLPVLSACNTGISDFQGGFERTSIAHAFSFAGCPAVVMTLWKSRTKVLLKLWMLFTAI